MKTLISALRIAFIATIGLLMALPAEAAQRSNLFGRNSRSFMGMGDSGAGEFYTVTPGVRSFHSQLRNIGGMGYTGGGQRFSMRFGGNSPRSLRSLNGRMSFTPLRGGGMRALVRSLNGARVGQPMTIFPGAITLAERGTTPTSTSFRFTGFDGFGFTREQLLNDVSLFGEALAKLIDTGFGDVNLFFQRLSAALLLQPSGTFDPFGPNFVTDTLNSAAGGIISGFPNPTVAQQVLTSPFDLVAFLDPILRTIDLNGDGSVNFLDERLVAVVERYIAANADKILQLLNESGLLSQLQQALDGRNANGYMPVSPTSPGTVEFTDSVVAVLENAGSSYIYLSRKGGSSGEATATVTLDSSTSPDPATFRFTDQTVTWRAGEAGPKAVLVKIVDDRVEDGDTGLGLKISAVTGASAGSGSNTQITIIDNEGDFTNSAIAVARNAVLVIEYSWPRNQRDLDTFTTFEKGIITPDASVGYTPASSALYAPYTAWSGDDTTGGGKEIVVIDLDSAISDGYISPFNVECLADYYIYADGSSGSGPAKLTVYFKDKVTGKTSPKAVADIFPDRYQPATSDSGAVTHVADIDVNYDSGAGTIDFTLTPFVPSP